MMKDRLQDVIHKIRSDWNNIYSVEVETLDSKMTKLCYKYSKFIGRGTFGVVILVEDIITKKKYALKKVFQDAKFHNRELEIFKNIQHENIVKLHHFYHEKEVERGRYLNLFMEYYPNNLEILIEKKERKINHFSCAFQLISAIEYLHSKGICHRDIKPANILLDEYLNKVVLCDMGSAKIMEDGGKNVPYVCSRYYRSPENILGVETYDFKIDVWSVGCVLVELHTYKTLFKGSSNAEMMSLILNMLKCSQADLLEMGCDIKEYKSFGIRSYLNEFVKNEKLIKLYENMLVFNPSKRASSQKLKRVICNMM